MARAAAYRAGSNVQVGSMVSSPPRTLTMDKEKQPERDTIGGDADGKAATLSVHQESDCPLPKLGIISTSPTKRQQFISHLQYATLCYTIFAAGWNDNSMGPLLPRMREVYDVSPSCCLLYHRRPTY